MGRLHQNPRNTDSDSTEQTKNNFQEQPLQELDQYAKTITASIEGRDG